MSAAPSSLVAKVALCVHLMTSLISAHICTNDVCQFHLVIRHDRNLVYRSKNGNAYEVRLKGDQLQTVENSYHTLPDEQIGKNVSADDVITADGVKRSIITVNGQFPGPTLEVMEGVQIVVHVHNRLTTEALSVHWHGIHQKGSPWMDGAAYVTQCPLAPRQTFTYRFTATPAGTHWYHSHLSNQRQDGLYGALIIHKRTPLIPYSPLIISDWFHELAGVFDFTSPYHTQPAIRGSGELVSDAPWRGYSTDGIETTAVTFVSALINGRGRHKPEEKFPLAEFVVSATDQLTLQVINAAGEFSFEVSIDQHELTIIASDGQSIEPITVDSLIVHVGETFDVVIQANSRPGKYWIRAETLREGYGRNNPNPDPRPDGISQGVKAILSYDDTGQDVEPRTHKKKCSPSDPCVVFNCPYAHSPKQYNRRCISIHEARSVLPDEILQDEYGLNDDSVTEYFLNVGFNWGSSINGKRFAEPMESLTDRFIYGDDSGIISCKTGECLDPQRGCICTHIVELPFNKTVQLVVSNLRQEEEDRHEHLFMGHHPMHLHGHHFALLHLAYPHYNQTTGRWTSANEDLTCDTPVCKKPTWKAQGKPALNLHRPPLKDTVLIPARGYAVFRFRSTNPGIWHFHCHADSHLMEGMNMVFHEAPSRYAPPPPGFPTCFHFSMSQKDFQAHKALADHYYKEGQPPHSAILNCFSLHFGDIVSTATLLAVAGIIFTDFGRGLCLIPVLFILTRCRWQRKDGYQLVKSE